MSNAEFEAYFRSPAGYHLFYSKGPTEEKPMANERPAQGAFYIPMQPFGMFVNMGTAESPAWEEYAPYPPKENDDE